MSGLKIEEVLAEIDDQPAQDQAQQQPAKPPSERKPADIRRDLRLIQRREARLQANY